VIVNFTTLIGVIFLVPAIMKLAGEYVVQFEGLVCGFAAGAISACAFFFLLFESTHLVAVGWTEEVEVIWRWGSMILAGFLLPAIIQVSVDAGVDVALKNKGDEVQKPAAEADAPTLSIRARLVGGILIGDFFHNLCDGFFIGAAFKGCGNSFGWTVAASTIFHEIAQELSDYFILTGPLAKIRPPVALGLNFISGLSVLLGAIIVCSEDIPDEQTGLLLAFGGGTYLHIAFTESMPRIYNPLLSVRARAASLGMFLVGAIAIGLVLLEHEHCVPSVAGAPAPASGGHHH
jgi:zinc transporter ZupT